MKKKYYVFTTSTNSTDGRLFNQTTFASGEEMPPFSTIVENVENAMREKGNEPVPNTTIILFMAKLTKQEYEALQKIGG